MNSVQKLKILIPMLMLACNDSNSMDDACYLIPETGPCEALITRYYYDQDANICSKFTWGGCDGVVPFENMEACEKLCGE